MCAQVKKKAQPQKAQLQKAPEKLTLKNEATKSLQPLPQSRPQTCTVQTLKMSKTTAAGEGSRHCERCVGVCVCVLCAPLYCKWDLKNWHSHLSGAARLSQTNEGPVPQSEIDISFSTSRGIF